MDDILIVLLAFIVLKAMHYAYHLDHAPMLDSHVEEEEEEEEDARRVRIVRKSSGERCVTFACDSGDSGDETEPYEPSEDDEDSSDDEDDNELPSESPKLVRQDAFSQSFYAEGRARHRRTVKRVTPDTSSPWDKVYPVFVNTTSLPEETQESHLASVPLTSHSS